MDAHFAPIAERVKEFLGSDSTGHDFYHAERVFNNAMLLHAKEQRGDRDVIGIAAWVHDICRPWEKKTGKSHFGYEALEIIREVLESAGIAQDKIPAILDIVSLHDIYDWTAKIEKTIELQIVQDADNLEALGAIGIARTFAFGGSANRPLYIPNENLEFENDFVDNPTDLGSSTIAHFYDKLLKLSQHMNTSSGKEVAAGRNAFMETFLAQFFAEWAGEK
ncbi:MAG TPA: HD domain-containing protein [Alphaproteobacteria bacterium]